MSRFFALFVLAALLLSLAPAFSDDGPSEAPKTRLHPDYAKIMASGKDIGFDPDVEIFYRIDKIIENQFYGNTSKKELADSVVRELDSLFAAYSMDNPLKDRDFDTPESVLTAALASSSTIPANLMKYACICGLFKGTGDPYSSFLTPKEYSSMMESLQSADFGGIGIYLELDKDNNNMLTVVEPIEGTPSWYAGLKAGDVIVEIDGVPTAGMDIDMCSARLRGPSGSEVVLGISRKGFAGLRKYKITRGLITAGTVSSRMLDSGVGYIRIRSFGRKTFEDFKKAFSSFDQNALKGVIIDLRNNGGGYVNAAIAVSGVFIGDGKTIISVKNKKGALFPKQARSSFHSDLPVSILINKYSASASEITAGAFQDYHRASVIGTKSFGKGSIQQLMPLRDGSAFKVTVAHYCTPSGRDIDKIGLVPDEEIEMEPRFIGSDSDTQIKRAEEILLGK